MEKLGVSPDVLLSGLQSEKNLLMAKKRELLREEDGFTKHSRDLRQIDDEIADIDRELIKLQRTRPYP